MERWDPDPQRSSVRVVNEVPRAWFVVPDGGLCDTYDWLISMTRRRLAVLWNDGFLTDAEYDALKAKLIQP
jgi:hypothetical protein